MVVITILAFLDHWYRNLLGAQYPEMKCPDYLLLMLLFIFLYNFYSVCWMYCVCTNHHGFKLLNPTYCWVRRMRDREMSQLMIVRARRFELARATLEVVGVLSGSFVYVEYEHIGWQLLSAIFCLYLTCTKKWWWRRWWIWITCGVCWGSVLKLNEEWPIIVHWGRNSFEHLLAWQDEFDP